MALTLDTSNHVNSSGTTSLLVPITTTTGSGQIYVCIGTNAASITSVTASGLTFNVRQAYFATGGVAGMATYVAAYTSNFSGNITIAQPTSVFITVDVVAIGGADTTSGIGSPPFDPGTLPVTRGDSTFASGTTTNANDFVIVVSTGPATATATAPWTIIPSSGADFLITMYRIVSATGTYQGASVEGTSGSMVDAIKQSTAVTVNLMGQIWM